MFDHTRHVLVSGRLQWLHAATEVDSGGVVRPLAGRTDPPGHRTTVVSTVLARWRHVHRATRHICLALPAAAALRSTRRHHDRPRRQKSYLTFTLYNPLYNGSYNRLHGVHEHPTGCTV